MLITKVTIKGAKQAVQMFGPAQAAVAQAVADSVADGIIPQDKAEDLSSSAACSSTGSAEDNAKIYKYNYEATKLAIKRAMKGEPKIDEIIAKKDTAKHPFAEVSRPAIGSVSGEPKPAAAAGRTRSPVLTPRSRCRPTADG